MQPVEGGNYQHFDLSLLGSRPLSLYQHFVSCSPSCPKALL
jgi:hypothetical protein